MSDPAPATLGDTHIPDEHKRALRARLMLSCREGRITPDELTDFGRALGLFRDDAPPAGHLHPIRRAEQKYRARVANGAKP